jgi:hypothetical protein
LLDGWIFLSAWGVCGGRAVGFVTQAPMWVSFFLYRAIAWFEQTKYDKRERTNEDEKYREQILEKQIEWCFALCRNICVRKVTSIFFAINNKKNREKFERTSGVRRGITRQ